MINKNLKNKKAQVTWIIGIVAILLIVIFLPFSIGFTTYFLTKNPFQLLGIFLVVMGAIGFFLKVHDGIAMTLLFMGIALLFIPVIFKTVAGITLAQMMP